jgi:hypothetical protein
VLAVVTRKPAALEVMRETATAILIDYDTCLLSFIR